ncbi:MAG: SRPBCC family protein [Myxococcota bacterium]
MAVITTDILIEGIRRDDVLDWLGDRANHARLLQGAFDGVKEIGPGDFELTVKAPPHTRTLRYTFDHVDTEHAGRRVHVKTAGRRLDGKLHYSLRTTKPSTNTMVTLHADFDSGVFGALVEQMGLRKRLEEGYRKVLENLQRELDAKR